MDPFNILYEPFTSKKETHDKSVAYTFNKTNNDNSNNNNNNRNSNNNNKTFRIHKDMLRIESNMIMSKLL